MATNNVLNEAIKKLSQANVVLREKINRTCDKAHAEKYKQEMTKNQAMILDYQFRLQYD